MVFPFSDFPGQSAHDVSDRVNTGESLGLRAAPRLPRPPCLSGILPVDDIAKIAVVFVFPVSDFRNLVTLVHFPAGGFDAASRYPAQDDPPGHDERGSSTIRRHRTRAFRVYSASLAGPALASGLALSCGAAV